MWTDVHVPVSLVNLFKHEIKNLKLKLNLTDFSVSMRTDVHVPVVSVRTAGSGEEPVRGDHVGVDLTRHAAIDVVERCLAVAVKICPTFHRRFAVVHEVALGLKLKNELYFKWYSFCLQFCFGHLLLICVFLCVYGWGGGGWWWWWGGWGWWGDVTVLYVLFLYLISSTASGQNSSCCQA